MHEVVPYWDWLEYYPGWWEMILTYGSSFAHVLLIPDHSDVPPDLTALCRTREK